MEERVDSEAQNEIVKKKKKDVTKQKKDKKEKEKTKPTDACIIKKKAAN